VLLMMAERYCIDRAATTIMNRLTTWLTMPGDGYAEKGLPYGTALAGDPSRGHEAAGPANDH
jgi:hypothetical protein